MKFSLNQLHDHYHVAKGKEPVLEQFPTLTGQQMRMEPKQMSINNGGFMDACVCELAGIYMSV